MRKFLSPMIHIPDQHLCRRFTDIGEILDFSINIIEILDFLSAKLDHIFKCEKANRENKENQVFRYM